jgi:hypothetical protein
MDAKVFVMFICCQDKLRDIEDDLMKCQQDMSETVWISPSSVDGVSVEEKEKMADRLAAQCRAGQNRLSELSSSATEKHKTDPSIFAPAELTSLQQHWAELLDKVWYDQFHLQRFFVWHALCVY